MAMDYKNAGVDIEAGYESVELMKKFVKGTMRPEVLGGLGGFSGAFSLKAIKDMEDPVLLSGTDEAALIGGETAEHPGLMPEDEYDLAGFAVGVVDRKDLITGENIKPGDTLIGIASTGVHSNGFSLVRKVFRMTTEALNTYYDCLGETLGEALIRPTRIYVKALKNVKEAGVTLKGCSHITGGGFYENIPRMLPEGVRAVVKKDSYPVLPIFRMLQEEGNIAEDPADVDKTMEAIKAAGDTPYVVGSVEAGEKGVTLC